MFQVPGQDLTAAGVAAHAGRAMASPVPFRRQPVQARSQARLDLILGTAAAMVAEAGVAALTTNHLAARAGIPVGSVYQYFPDKGALLTALAQSQVAAFEATLALPADPDPANWQLAHEVERGVSGLAAFMAAHPAFPQLYLAARAGGGPAAAMLDGGAAHFAAIFAARAPHITAETRSRHAHVVVETAQALLALAAAGPDRDAALPATMREVIDLITRYLAPFYG
jgi:AcrR family transcriptional regulator